MNSFALPPTLVRELGYLFNGGQHSGWADRVSELLRVSPRTVESWARGERDCEGPPALLMAYLARMMVDGSYSDISIDEVNKIVENHGKKVSLDLSSSEVRTRIRSVIKLQSSIKKVSEDLKIDRSALTRWLSGESALGFDPVFKVLDHLGLNRSANVDYETTWHVRLDWESLDEIIQDVRNGIEIFFPDPPECSITQVGKPAEKITKFKVILLLEKTRVVIQLSMPNKLARHSQGLNWLVSAFACVHSFTFYCPLGAESD
jgi:hypothetical protein